MAILFPGGAPGAPEAPPVAVEIINPPEGSSIGDLTLNDAAKAWQLGSSFTCKSLTFTAGTLDPNEKTLTVENEVTIVAGAQFLSNADAMNNFELIIGDGDNSSMAGAAGNLLLLGGTNATATWMLTVQAGTLTVNCASVGYSNASGGTTVVATHSSDEVSNDNWDFGTLTGGRGLLLLGIGR